MRFYRAEKRTQSSVFRGTVHYIRRVLVIQEWNYSCLILPFYPARTHSQSIQWAPIVKFKGLLKSIIEKNLCAQWNWKIKKSNLQFTIPFEQWCRRCCCIHYVRCCSVCSSSLFCLEWSDSWNTKIQTDKSDKPASWHHGCSLLKTDNPTNLIQKSSLFPQKPKNSQSVKYKQGLTERRPLNHGSQFAPKSCANLWWVSFESLPKLIHPNQNLQSMHLLVLMVFTSVSWCYQNIHDQCRWD